MMSQKAHDDELCPSLCSFRIPTSTPMTSHPSLDTLRSNATTPRPYNIPLLFRHLPRRILHILSLKHILRPPSLLVKEIVLQGVHGCNPFVWVVFEEFGEEVEAQGGFAVVFEVPFFEVVGVLSEGCEMGVFGMEGETGPFVA